MATAKSNNSSILPTINKKPTGLRKIINLPVFGKIYAILAVAILLASTVLWSLLSAKLQRGNADQLVNTYLFEHASTFHGALIPAQHSFLIKWPIFLLIKLFGASASTFTTFTVGLVIITVSALAAILYWIERRPLVFGTICLALASVLLLIPARPYAGALLPVNMAMLATRNLEYIVYIVSLALLIKSSKVRSWSFLLATILLALLIASDKLFLAFSIGGAVAALIVFALSQHWKYVTLSVNWLVNGLIAGLSGISILWLLNRRGVVHVVSQSSTSPYGFTHGAQNLILGSLYAVLGLITNFGANPVYDVTIVRNLPHQLAVRILSLSGIGYMVNALILAFGILFALQLIIPAISHGKLRKPKVDNPQCLSIILLCTTVIAFGAFVVSNHYYAVDARYLTINLFAIFISATTFVRNKCWQPEKLLFAGFIIIVGIACGLTATEHSYTNSTLALAEVNKRNLLVSQVLAQHPVNVLVGDYWRVMPTKLLDHGNLNVLPLAACTHPRNDLSSTAWQPDLHTHSFAYLLTLDKSLTDYPVCTLNQIIDAYGRPNASTVMVGTLSQPKEMLLFYDHGSRKSAPSPIVSQLVPATILPINLEQLPNPVCSVPTVMNIVAHQDDDLLFMNPDLTRDINDKRCIRTIYITAGDDGANKFYWLSREQGSMAAYDRMDGPQPDVWIQRIVMLAKNEYVTVASPRGNAKITLIFMHLPDGNLRGEGFNGSQYESLAKLEAGKINQMHSVDRQSSYTSDQLITALTTLMHFYQPAEIRTQANFISTKYPDHSDHMAVGRFVQHAYSAFEDQQYGGHVIIPIKYYIGYPIRQTPENLSWVDINAKTAIFLNYAKFDSAVCQSEQQCQQNPTYNAYLHRQYQSAY